MDRLIDGFLHTPGIPIWLKLFMLGLGVVVPALFTLILGRKFRD